MRLRHPPGRAGRLWLQHRAQVATTGADLLDKKRRALVQEHRRLRAVVRDTETRFATASAEAETWVNRVAVMAGEAKLSMLATVHSRAEVTVRWRSSMGVAFASEAQVELGRPPRTAFGGSSAADLAVFASRQAVETAVQNAAAQSALRRIGAELAITSRRQRALERRWLPELTAAAKNLSDALDELEREEATRSAWVARRSKKPSP